MLVKKICVIGEFGVGKTSLIRRYVLSEFSETYRATLSVNLYKFTDHIHIQDQNIETRLVIWDVEGASMPTPQTLGFIRGASAALIIGDCSREDPKQGMMRYAEAFEKTVPGRPFQFILNKMDLTETPNAEHFIEAKQTLEDRFGAQTLFTSAKENMGVIEAFRSLALRIYQLDV